MRIRRARNADTSSLAAWLTRVGGVVGLGLVAALVVPAVRAQGSAGEDDPGLPVAPAVPLTDGSFRMEGAATLDLVFGDSADFVRRVDRFDERIAAMDALRRTFGEAALASRRALAEPGRGCPDGLREPYAAVLAALAAYQAVGVGMERDQRAIAALAALGENAGLTPDDRVRVNRAPSRYRAARTDYRELRATLLSQLRPELISRRCTEASLLDPPPPTAAPPAVVDDDLGAEGDEPQSPALDTPDADEGRASVAVTVDNRGCDRPMDVIIGEVRDRVEPRSQVAFRARAGRRAVCIVVADAGGCDTPGARRSAYIHEGWSVAVFCEPDSEPAPADLTDR